MSTTMESTVELLDGMAFSARTGSGQVLTLDAPAEGMPARGPKPIELMLVGLGGCTAFDVIAILRKMRQDVSGYQVRVRGERSEQHPMVFTHIAVEHVVRGRGVSAEAVRRAVELSATRYCSVSAMLGKAVAIEQSYRVIDEAVGMEITAPLELVSS